MIVKPFRGVRPRADLAHRVPSPPYDVLDSEEARRLAADDPYSFLHVVKPEIDLAPDVDPYDDRVYEQAGRAFRRMLDEGWLVRDERPSYYVYRLTMDGRSQTGILGAAAVEDYVEGRIRKHEHTRPEKERDRVRLNTAIGANPGPVFLTYHALPELNALVRGVIAGQPVADFGAPDGVQHRLWVVSDTAHVSRIESLFAKIRASYIADGHHRAAAAAQVGGDTFLVAMFPAEELRVMDYNRVVADLNGLDPDSLLERIGAAGFHVKHEHRRRRPPHRETFGMYLAGRWYLLTVRPEIVPESDPVRRLDVSVLTERLLQPILGIGDPRTDTRIDFVGGIRGMDELERLVDSGRFAVAFALYPTRIAEVINVADAGQVMPPKSTWFEPKLRSGLVVQIID